jgi:hypothetical protein
MSGAPFMYDTRQSPAHEEDDFARVDGVAAPVTITGWRSLVNELYTSTRATRCA